MPTTTTNKTAKLGLSQYVNNDIVSVMTNYNSDMLSIDNGLGTLIAELDSNGKLKQMPSASDVGAVPTSLKINGYTLTGDRTLTANDVGAATTAQGAKADNAVQGVQVNGTDLTADSNKKVNVTLSGLGGVASSTLGVASGVATTNTNNKVIQDPASYGTANGAALLPSTLPTDGALAAFDAATPGKLAVATEKVINLGSTNFSNYGGLYANATAGKLGNRVELRGMVVSSASSVAAGTEMIYIPDSAFWPKTTTRFQATGSSGTTTWVLVDVTAEGKVILQSAMSNAPWVYLYGIVYNV